MLIAGHPNAWKKPVKAALLSLFMLSGIAAWGVGIYAADAAANHTAVDGYGVTSAR